MTDRFAVAWSSDQRLWLVLDQYLKRTRSSFTERAGADTYARLLNRDAAP